MLSENYKNEYTKRELESKIQQAEIFSSQLKSFKARSDREVIEDLKGQCDFLAEAGFEDEAESLEGQLEKADEEWRYNFDPSKTIQYIAATIKDLAELMEKALKLFWENLKSLNNSNNKENENKNQNTKINEPENYQGSMSINGKTKARSQRAKYIDLSNNRGMSSAVPNKSLNKAYNDKVRRAEQQAQEKATQTRAARKAESQRTERAAASQSFEGERQRSFF